MSDEVEDIYGNLTPLDFAEAIAFATNQISMFKCKDKEILDSICGEKGTTCLQWKIHKDIRQYQKKDLISNIKCQKNSDCKEFMSTCKEVDVANTYDPDTKKWIGPNSPYQKRCIYKIPDSGLCHIIDKDVCLKNSVLPYTCNTEECKLKDKKILNKTTYTEWNENGGICDSNKSCNTTSDCADDQSYCIHGKCKLLGGTTCKIGSTCENGKCTCNTDDDCNGASTCNADNYCEKAGICQAGNWIGRQWCENPQSRCTPNDDGSLPTKCVGKQSQGITDVPPFYYAENTGQCFMTKQYCDYWKQEYSGDTCNTQKPCPSGQMCHDGYCVGSNISCKSSTGEKIAQFTIGETIFKYFQGIKCQPNNNNNENSFINAMKTMHQKFDSLPNVFNYSIDPSEIEKTHILSRNFVPGVDLEYYKFKNNNKPQTGLNMKQLKIKYPNIFRSENSIQINRSDLAKDNNLKRIYLLLNTKDNMTSEVHRLATFVNNLYAHSK